MKTIYTTLYILVLFSSLFLSSCTLVGLIMYLDEESNDNSSENTTGSDDDRVSCRADSDCKSDRICQEGFCEALICDPVCTDDRPFCNKNHECVPGK